MKTDPFKEYLLESEPTKKELGYSWYTAIGLQKVDGLETSDYLKSVAIDNIDGNITIEKAKELINSYYIENENHQSITEEADKVAVNIAKILSENSFVFSPAQYLDIHKKLFNNVFSHAGEIRNYNISKKEWVLDGDTVIYGGASVLKETLEYDFNIEKSFDYTKLNKKEFISHIAKFIANIWQIHIFREGNTRTTAVFLIKYLRKFGYNVTNNIFAENAWYFRNALVRANYTNIEKNIYETTKYLELFLNNLIFNDNNDLKNRYLHIGYEEKVDIESKKVDIDNKKVDIHSLKLTSPMKKNIDIMIQSFSNVEYFGRNEIIEALNISASGASKVISKLLDLQVIKPVLGYGKGKYCLNVTGVNYE